MNERRDEDRRHERTYRVRIDIGWGSILRLSMAVLLAYLVILLWPIFKVLVLAILIAVALHPMVVWVVRKGGPHWLGVLMAATLLLVVVVSFFAIVVPMIFKEVRALAENLPQLREQILAHLPSTGLLHEALQKGMNPGTVADSRSVLTRLLVLLGSALGGLLHLLIVVVLSFYLLVDGPRAFKWLIVFFPLSQREKLAQALGQIARNISSYVAGQFIISALAATYLFVVLKLLGVPTALALAIFAGLCDVLPIIGFCFAVFLAMGMALSVSPMTAFLVLLLYGGYHLFENLFIVPKAYEKKLHLSRLAVPLAVAAGGLLAGIVGAIAVLPLMAAYPVVERLWLAAKLAPDTVKAHQETPL